MAENYISYGDFENICKLAGIDDPETHETIIEFLHDLGVVLHFDDLPLADTNVINPRWVAEGVYRIIDSQQVANDGGILRLRALGSILDPVAHPREKHNFFIELMKKFELCYQLSPRAVLLPGLLPIEEPTLPVMNDAVRFNIKYTDFIPKSIMPRFIVRMHAEIENDLRWRTGVVLYNRQLATRTLVRVDEAENLIELSVSGQRRREYLGIVLHALREINESFGKLRFQERVVLPDNPMVSIDYNHLARLEESGTPEHMPEGADHNYDVGELLGWVPTATSNGRRNSIAVA